MVSRRLSLFGSCCLLALVVSAGCAPTVGDECTSDDDCPTDAICDSTAPEGYCTIPDCTPGSCPRPSICVEFDEASSYCMKPCEDDSDCRDDYTCRYESNSRPFCYVEG